MPCKKLGIHAFLGLLAVCIQTLLFFFVEGGGLFFHFIFLIYTLYFFNISDCLWIACRPMGIDVFGQLTLTDTKENLHLS